MRKIYKKIVVLMLFLMFLFGIYLYKLHSLAVEGNKIFEQRCLNVNPFLISYKNSFLNFADAIKNPTRYSAEQTTDFYIQYFQGVRDYYPKEAEWVKTQTDFINRWDFKLIEPWYVKEAGQYQVLMYEGYRDEAKSIIDALDGKISNEEFESRFAEARDKRNKYTDLYNRVFDKALPIRDWGKIFGSVPIPAGRNDANLTIPDTTGALDEEPAPVEKPDITG